MLRKTFYIIFCTICILGTAQGQTGTARTWSEIMALLPDNVVGAISPQDLRDLWQTTIDSVGARARLSLVTAHTSATDNPHEVTATQLSLGNVTNESKTTMFTNPTFTGSTGLTVQGGSFSTRIANNYIGVTTGDTDAIAFWVNYLGYAFGTTRYRDFIVGDGKQDTVIFADGSTKQVTFHGTVDLNNNVIQNVDSLNGESITDLDYKLIDFNFTNMGTNPASVGVFQSLRYRMDITSNTEITVYNTTGEIRVISLYLEYTGQPTVTFTAAPGQTIIWAWDTAYTGPSEADVMDKIVIEVWDASTLIMYPAVLGIPTGDL